LKDRRPPERAAPVTASVAAHEDERPAHGLAAGVEIGGGERLEPVELDAPHVRGVLVGAHDEHACRARGRRGPAHEHQPRRPTAFEPRGDDVAGGRGERRRVRDVPRPAARHLDEKPTRRGHRSSGERLVGRAREVGAADVGVDHRLSRTQMT
jgi:hypothetical protein